MSDPTFTAPPAAPSRSDAPATFISRANAFIAWFATLYAELVAFVAWLSPIPGQVAEDAADIAAAAAVATDGVNLVGKSTSTLTVGAGTKTIHLSAPKPSLATLNRRVAIVSVSDPSIKMFGNIATTDGADDITVTVASNGVFGSGSYSNWQIIDAAFYASGATAAELLAQATDAAAVTPKAIKDAKAFVALTDAATVTPDGLAGRNFTWTLAGDHTLGAITHCAPGDVFTLEITQDGTGGRDLAWAAIYLRQGGLPGLAQGAGDVSILQIRILEVDGSGTATSAFVSFATNLEN